MNLPFKLSIVVPLFNEEGNVEELHREIKDVCEENKYEYEIIFVDDGSGDNTQKLSGSLSPLKYIRLRRNFGQTAAMDAGIKAAEKDFIIIMDGDRQNDPKDIPNLIEKLINNNLDVVSGWRRKRKDPFLKRFISKGARLLRGLMIKDGIHDSGCSLKIYRRECFKGVSLYGEMHRFIPAVLKIKGFKIGEIEVNHRPRVSGVTKYTWKRTVKGFLDMVSVWFWQKFAVRPLHLLGGLAIVCFIIGVIVSIFGIVFYFSGITLFKNVLPLMSIFFFLSGLQLIIFGLIADMIAKNYFGTTEDAPYSIEKTVIIPEKDESDI